MSTDSMRPPRHCPALPALVCLLSLGLLLSGCSDPRPEIVVAFDEAFAATRPDLVTALRAPSISLVHLSYLELALDQGPSRLVELLGARKSPPLAIAASPLIIRALIEGAARNGLTPPKNLVSMEGYGESAPGSALIGSDPRPAGRKAGAILGALVADWRRGSTWSGAPDPSAGAALVYMVDSEPQGGATPGRGPDDSSPGSSAASAFAAAFLEGWNSAAAFPPQVEAVGPGMRIATAESKVRNLLSGDIKAILVGAGSGSAAAMTAAATATPVRVTGIVTESAGDAALAWPTASFAICPDEAGLARALRSWRPGSNDQAILIPWIIRILPGADLLKASGIDLEVRLR